MGVHIPFYRRGCFAFENRKCTVTTRKDCLLCKFYKTKEELNTQRAISFERAYKRGYYPKGYKDYVNCAEYHAKN